MEVCEIDPGDEAAFAAWFAVVAAVEADERPDEPGWQLQELRALALAGRPGAAAVAEVRPYAVTAGGRTVGAAWLKLSQRDNLHIAGVSNLSVLPGERRRGVGSLLVAALDAAARAAGRTELLGEGREPLPQTATHPGHAFALARGFAVAQQDVQRDLDVPADPARLDALERDCGPYAEGYALRAWGLDCPGDLVEGRVLLGRRMSTDAPNGDVPREEEQWDVARVRHGERLLREQGRDRLAVGAVHVTSGQLVAFTEITLPTSAPERAYQWDTLVLREHRGHRLGTLVKVENLRRLAAVWPHTRVVSTGNAAQNAPMIAVNDALGCRVAGLFVEWLRPVSGAAGR